MYLIRSKKNLIILITSLFTLGSCNKTCQTGYENPNCSIEIRNQFENVNYTVTESKNGDSAYTYSATIVSSPASILQVQLTNMANNFFVNNVTATVSNDTLTIPYQTPDSNARYIIGLGILSGNTVYINYAITYPTRSHRRQTDYYQSTWVHP